MTFNHIITYLNLIGVYSFLHSEPAQSEIAIKALDTFHIVYEAEDETKKNDNCIYKMAV